MAETAADKAVNKLADKKMAMIEQVKVLQADIAKLNTQLVAKRAPAHLVACW